MDTGYLLLAVGVAALITAGLRALPFAIRHRLGDSELMDDLARWMPLGIVVVLAVHALANIGHTGAGEALPTVAGVAVTVVMHLWRRNLLLSVFSGTAVCVLLAALA
jgi:branched chain amino acid efflux pump